MTNSSAKFPIFNVEEIIRKNTIITIIIIIITNNNNNHNNNNNNCLNFALVCRPNVILIL